MRGEEQGRKSSRGGEWKGVEGGGPEQRGAIG